MGEAPGVRVGNGVGVTPGARMRMLAVSRLMFPARSAASMNTG